MYCTEGSKRPTNMPPMLSGAIGGISLRHTLTWKYDSMPAFYYVVKEVPLGFIIFIALLNRKHYL